MTLNEIEDQLPNGLHDAVVSRFEVDYARRLLIIQAAIWIGNLDGLPKQHELYRKAILRLSGLQFFVSEAPDAQYPFANSEGLTIDACDMAQHLSAELVESLPRDVFLRSLWVSEWNAFIHIAARDASIEWLDVELKSS